MNRYRPGPGWKTYPQTGVREHVSGVRVHVHGIALLPDGTFVERWNWPESQEIDWFVRVNGGNQIRGVMAWARARLINK